MPPIKHINGIDVKQMAKTSNIIYHTNDPKRYPKVQSGYEGLAQVIYSTQTNKMMADLTKEMLNISKQ